MSLRELELKPCYNSDKDNILEEFYIPALSESVKYKRIAGFFSSNSFAIAARGIAKFILNGGRIELISNVVIDPKDYEMINKHVKDSYSEIEKKYIAKAEENFLKSIDMLEDGLKNDHIKMLGWLMKKGKLEIKIAVVPNGLQHQKTGILEDKEGNQLSFTGSDNETQKGWITHTEKFHVFCSWKGGDLDHLKSDIKDFENFWKNLGIKTRIYTVSEAVEKKLIEKAPRNFEEFKKISYRTTKELLKKTQETKKQKKEIPDELKLRYYQLEAVNNWFDNSKLGFFSMATGTGKTETAIGAIKRLFKEKDKCFIIIAVHGQSLLKQWMKKLKKYGLNCDGASSIFSKWREEFRNHIMGFSLGYEKYGIVVTTYQTLASKDFIEIIKDIDSDIMLICDEAHHAGAPKIRKGLLDNYSYRLGLSATPERWFDEEGSSFLHNYFGKTVYLFTMKRAMKEKDPDIQKPFLCGYKYYPIIVNLTPDESEEFLRLTRKISQRVHVLKKFDINDKILRNLLLLRANKKKNASQKIPKFLKLMESIGNNLEYCIIYCSEKQMVDIKRILQRHKKIYTEFTQHQTPDKREKILKDFELGRENGGYDVLLAIDCLNEGIDVPKAKYGIIMESSQNPIEFIQRRGRLLRQHEEKDEAIIYDFLVEPTFSSPQKDDYWNLERKEIQKEFDRFAEFALLSKNTQECFKIMEKIINEYDLIIKIKEDDIL